jgi:SAM-dependent methyltransferase
MKSERADPVLARYADAARRAVEEECVCAPADSPFGAHHYDEFDELANVPTAATRVSLGCGNPLAVAELREGETVLDLGAGGGLDVLLSGRRVGPTGQVYGIDATREMVDLARRNAAEAGAANVEFLHGTIERIPLDDASVDVVISNCVIVLSADKGAVFREVARVLRPDGRIGISDIVRIASGGTDRPAVDCGGGALTVDDYDAELHRAGLDAVSIDPTEPLGGGLSNAVIRATKPRHEGRCCDQVDGPCSSRA